MARIREDGPDRIETHVAGVCIRWSKGRWKLLAGKRTDKRSLFPGKWECGGGQVRRGESFPAAIKRQIFEEFGLEVEPLYVIEAYEIHVPDQQIIPGIRFLCLAKHGRVRLNLREFTSHRWMDIPVPELDWIPGVKEMLSSALAPERLSGLDYLVPYDVPPRKLPPGFIGPTSAMKRA